MQNFIFIFLIFFIFNANAAEETHALSLFTAPKYNKNFTNFDYVNKDAPKGGEMRLYSFASFDSLNPFILKGLSAPGMDWVFETLMTKSLDEPQTYYPLIARSVKLADDKKSIIFYIDKRAKFHDDTRITPEDVIFSFNILKNKGSPIYKILYKDVSDAQILPKNAVKFSFSTTNNRELPFLLAELPIFSKKYYTENDFAKSSLKPPLGSGAYEVSSVNAGRNITFKRVKNYWAANLPTRRGQFNFDKISFDVYRDETVALEAFKAGEYDFREEYIARNWATGYDSPAVQDGRIQKHLIPHKIPQGMQGFIFNLRKTKFNNIKVRKAISLTMDFEWLNRTIFFNAYKRSSSFFQNTVFMANTPPSKAEIALLGSNLGIYLPPKNNGSGDSRENLLKAQKLLNDAGWIIKNGVRINAKTGEQLTVEFLMRQTTFQRVILPMIKNLKRLGIKAKFRLVDDATYQKRIENKDFDIVTIWWGRGISFAGAEQMGYWHSSQADIIGGQNLSGLKSPIIDKILKYLLKAKNYDELYTATRALDRLLSSKYIVIPHWHISSFRIAWWNKFGRPKITPEYSYGLETWWDLRAEKLK